jgi:hypothetical protein
MIPIVNWRVYRKFCLSARPEGHIEPSLKQRRCLGWCTSVAMQVALASLRPNL